MFRMMGLAALTAVMATPVSASAMERFRCTVEGPDPLILGIDAAKEVMTLSDGKAADQPACDMLVSLIDSDNPDRVAVLATKGQCRTSIDGKYAITDWPVRTNATDMSLIAVFDRTKLQFALYGRRTRSNLAITGKCTAL